ncbi:MAG: MotA/TolQ/ExbB proton channel family protein [Pseudomonadota bacterium]
MNEILNPLLSFIELGGPVVTILVGLSVIALAIVGLKAVQFYTTGVGSRTLSREAMKMWKTRNKSGAVTTLTGKAGALNKSLLVGMKALTSKEFFKEDVEEMISTTALQELHELQRGFRALEAIAQIAPLLGLFGTVLGMIDAFQALQAAGSSVDPSILAGGIWVALLTTAAGLAVAMPVSLVLTWFETKVDDERIAIQAMSSELLNDQFSFALAEDVNISGATGVVAHAT